METWRLLLEAEASPAANMAVDEALLRAMRSRGRPVLRIYGWDRPCQSLGYFQPAAEAIPDLPFVRRYTGGGLVDHREDLTYTVVLPRAHPLLGVSMAESYAAMHEGVAEALTLIGLDAELAAQADATDSSACFQKAVCYDVTVHGRKVAGAAQRRTREGLLHQGSVLLPDPGQRPDLRKVLPEAMAEALRIEFSRDEITPEEAERAAKFERERYATEAWNQQR
ncbi:MAG: biotin/lipoate A/B protein ligase family protein [Verrucomicrobiota bacterium]